MIASLQVKIFFMDEILKIKQRLKHAEEMKCTDEIEHFKSTIIKILLQNLSILTNATYKHSQNETVVVENYDKNSANVPFEIPKRTINVKNARTGNAKDVSDNKMVSLNRFESLSLCNDDRDDFLSDKHAFVSTNIIDKSVRLRNSNTKPDPLQIPLESPNLNRRPLICTTEKYLNNFVPQRRVTPGNQTYANAVATEKKKTCIICDSHLARITKSSFRTGEERNFVIFKCFRGANTKQLDYYVVPTLVDEKPESIILHIGSNDITKQIMIILMQKILVNELLTLRKNVDCLVLTTLQFHPF